MENFITELTNVGVSAGSKIIQALVVFIIGSFIIKKVIAFLKKKEVFVKVDPTVGQFAFTAISIVLKILLILSVIGILGVPMASIVTVLATAGVAVGMALQGSLSNLAGGIMLIIFRPFRIGDYIAAAGEEGTVREISLFYTVVITNDNKRIMIPNGSLMNANVTNVTAESDRRVDLELSCGKGEDVDKVQAILLDVMNANQKVLQSPAPFANLSGGTNESMIFTIRAWCKTGDYWDVYFALLTETAKALGAAGISAPGLRVISETAK